MIDLCVICSTNTDESSHVTLHHTSVTFDNHVGEVFGTLTMGDQIVILRPYGDLDMELFSKTINRHQITDLPIVPSQMVNISSYLHEHNKDDALKTH